MSEHSTELVIVERRQQITLLTMNMPHRLNGWTFDMMESLKGALSKAADDPDTAVVILTGTDPYYSAGVNLGGTMKLMHPRILHGLIVEQNRALFEAFLNFPKPILAAVNGPAIGACVTSATLCDGIIASDKATFSTPFAKLGMVPEGCSSVLFERLMGARNAERMLGKDGWVPTAHEALQAGLVQWVVPHEQLLANACDVALEWIAAERQRTFRGASTHSELLAVNAEESVGVADSILSAHFMKVQQRFLWSRGKRIPASVFFALRATRFLWGRLLP